MFAFWRRYSPHSLELILSLGLFAIAAHPSTSSQTSGLDLVAVAGVFLSLSHLLRQIDRFTFRGESDLPLWLARVFGLTTNVFALLSFVWWFVDPLISGLHHPGNLQAATALLVLCLGCEYPFVAARLRRYLSTPLRAGLSVYLFTSMIGGYAFTLPVSLQSNAQLSFLDGLFVAISALTVTGLSPIAVFDVLSLQGQILLLGLIQLGGLGIVALTATIYFVTFKRLSLSQSQLAQAVYDVRSLGNIPQFMKRVLGLTLVCEAIGFLVLWIFHPETSQNSAFSALFHSVSAFCNAGFSVLPNGLTFEGGLEFKAAICALVFVGGLGFPVVFELLDGRKHPHQKLSPHGFLSLNTSLAVFVTGTVGLFLLDSSWSWASLGESVFYSISTRTAGFQTTDLAILRPEIAAAMMILMMIGAGSVSTGGGIKVGTLACFLIGVMSFIRGSTSIRFRHREISDAVFRKSATVIFLYVVSAFVGFLILLGTERTTPAQSLLYEVISALSTVGLSQNVTSDLSPIGKLTVMGLMLLGRLGFMTILLTFVGRQSPSRVRYPNAEVFVG